MTKGEEKQLFSEEISRFVKFLEEARREYDRCEEERNRQEQLKLDYLHLLELRCSSYRDRAKISTLLRQCLVERRKCKDTMAVLEPLVQFLGTDRGKLVMNQLPQLVGAMRKEEKRIANQTYAPRAMTYVEYENAGEDR